MKYKPCCDRRCMLFGCEIQEKGGCYCLCRLFDHIKHLQRLKNGNEICLYGYSIYFPDASDLKKELGSMSEEQKRFHFYRVAKVDEDIENTKIHIKKYEIAHE